MTIRPIYRAAKDLTRHYLNDVVGRICVQSVQAFAAGGSLAVLGPVRGFIATSPIGPDPREAAASVATFGRPVALSIVVYRAMPGLDESDPPLDVAALLPVDGGPCYWFSAAPGRERSLDPAAPVLLLAQTGAPPAALPLASLWTSFAAASSHKGPILSQAMLELVSSARDRALAEMFTKTSVVAMQEQQTLLAGASSGPQARRLAALGALPLIPLRVTREELDGAADGPIRQLLAKSAWTIRQPVIDEWDGRVSRYVDGHAGAKMVASNFGGESSSLLCLDPGRLEFETVRTFSRGVGQSAHRANVDPIRTALAVSHERELAFIAQEGAARVVKLRSVYKSS